ncbi:MAG: hypothetical protein JKY65_03745 [Planctomycetes bacterium]|nr:hypothetical protein [Planctomycetota bacterium]
MPIRASLLLFALCLVSLASGQDRPVGPVRPPANGASDDSKRKGIYLRYAFERLDGYIAEYRIQTILRQSKRIVLSGGDKDARRSGQGSAVSTTRQTYTCRFTRGKRGKSKVHITPTRLEATIEENGQRTRSYDSKKNAHPPKGLEALTLRLNKTAVLEVNRLGFVKRIRGVKAGMRKAYRKNFHRFPSRELTIGKGWESKTKQPMPPFGNLHYFTTFRLKEIGRTDEGLERYTIKAKLLVTYEGISPTESSKLEITEQSGGGHLIVDERGLLLEEKLKSRVVYLIKALAGRERHVVQTETVRWLTSLRKVGEEDE